MPKKPVCWGAGLIALDVIVNGSPNTPPKLTAGGSCGNVMTILSFLGWSSNPVARLADNNATKELLEDFKNWKVKTEFVTTNNSGSTPIIIHRILKNKKGNPVHRFEFKNPNTGAWLPGYKPLLSKGIPNIASQLPTPNVFYFDRVSRATIDLATEANNKGAVVFFEPSSIGDESHFQECLKVSHIIKFSNERIPDFKKIFKSPQVDLEIETLGKDGLNFRSAKGKGKGNWNKIEPFKISELTDSAGAGDWCAAGIINNLCREGHGGLKKKKASDIKLALLSGQLLGAVNCFFDGARGIMYSLDKKKFNRISKIIPSTEENLSKAKIGNSAVQKYKEYSAGEVNTLIF